MGLMTNPNDGRADRLAPWVRQMDLADQIFVTGTTLIFEDIRLRRTDLPFPIDEASLREGSPESAYRGAARLAAAYADQPPHPGDDGVDEHWRVANMARELAELIARYHPEVLGGSH